MTETMSVCGTDCAACACLGAMCPGCKACQGRVFHAPAGQACPIFACVREKRDCKAARNAAKRHALCGELRATRP